MTDLNKKRAIDWYNDFLYRSFMDAVPTMLLSLIILCFVIAMMSAALMFYFVYEFVVQLPI